jgi:hypothetical protein
VPSVVGVPEITPVAALSDRPTGNAPTVTVQALNGGFVPLAARLALYGSPTLPFANDEVATVTPVTMRRYSGSWGRVPPSGGEPP